MKRALVVGSGAGGATVAKELQGTYEVSVLEAGGEFRPFSLNLAMIERLKKTGLLFDEREIEVLFPAMNIRKTGDRMVLVNGVGLGGTTTLATGNGVRLDSSLKELGINLDEEFEELEREIPISTDHQNRWRKATRRLFETFVDMKLDPRPLPKMGDQSKCINCGRCVLGCANGAKWDSRQFLNQAIAKGGKLVTRCRVERIVIDGNRTIGLQARVGWRTEFIPADLVVLAAGGFGTPAILENSGIECVKRLFVDPVLCVATEWKGAMQNAEISMPFVSQQDGFILAPYFDYLSFFFNRDWKFAANDTLSLMIKLADSEVGGVRGRRIEKSLTQRDKERLQSAVELCQEIFWRLGVHKEKTFLGTLNAGHPGGMLPLTKKEAQTFHSDRLPANVYVADATLFPSSLGNPPILTILAVAKRISKICTN
jgi:choline dehydrogenase-like flavoprotein